MQSKIPTSTLHNWKKKNTNELFGIEHASDFNNRIELLKTIAQSQKLLQAAKALYWIYQTQKSILEKLKNRKQVLYQSKKEIIEAIEQSKYALGLQKAIQQFSISYQQYNAWSKHIACKKEKDLLCRKKNYHQLSFKEVHVIKDYLYKAIYRHWSLAAIYYQMMRDKKAFCSQTTFYKYAKLLKPERIRARKKKYSTGIRADSAKKMLHMDVTIYRPLDHTKLYIYLICDNFSRKILGFKVSKHYNSQIAFENLKEAYYKHELSHTKPYVYLITDGGIENHGKVDRFINHAHINLRKLIAQTDIIQSNSMIEAVNKRMKYDFLFTQKLLDKQAVIKYLDWAVPEYNSKPHSALFGYTPDEVFAGALPDRLMFKPAIQAAKEKRKQVNLNDTCFNCFV
jgi:hypothetical protein